MSNNADKISKLASKLGVIDEKISNLNIEKREIVAEMRACLDNEGNDEEYSQPPVKPAKASYHKKAPSKMKPGDLGEKILAVLTGSGGLTTKQVTNELSGVDHRQVALSMSHLVRKNRVFEDNERFFAAANEELNVAAKVVTE